ncbi:hypothetical protein SM033_00033 [Vibrio phage vB_VpaM_sm033]|nr:hypothetical protein SM033_00033 [Vibrio phage vB_VpaM_sm033]
MTAALIIFGCLFVCQQIYKRRIWLFYDHIREDSSTYEVSPLTGQKQWLTAEQYTAEMDEHVKDYHETVTSANPLWVWMPWHWDFQDIPEAIRLAKSTYWHLKAEALMTDCRRIGANADIDGDIFTLPIHSTVGMFNDCAVFNQDLSGWKVSEVCEPGIDISRKFQAGFKTDEEVEIDLHRTISKLSAHRPIQPGEITPSDLIDQIRRSQINWDDISDKPHFGVSLPDPELYKPGDFFELSNEVIQCRYVLIGMDDFKEWKEVTPAQIRIDVIGNTYDLGLPDGMLVELDDEYDYRHGKVFVIRNGEAKLIKRDAGDMFGFTPVEYRELASTRYL